MSYKIAVASSDGITIDAHFGSTTQFYILQVNDDESYQILEDRRVSESVPGSTQDSCSGAKDGCGNRQQGSCGNHQSGGCGGHSDASINAKVELIADCRCLLCLKCGPGAERQLERKAITVFQIDISIENALKKIIPYYSKLDHHISLRKG